MSVMKKIGGVTQPDLETKCYKIIFKTIEGYIPLLSRKMEGKANDVEYILYSTMYIPPSLSNHTHQSLPLNLIESIHEGVVISPIDHVCFFHALHNISSLLLVMELVAMPTASDTHSFTLGWGILSIDKQNLEKGPLKIRVPLYEGSPRVLFTMDNITTVTSSLNTIPGCIVTLSLTYHPTLTKITHLIPEHTLIAFDDIIPGTIHTNITEAFPKVMKTHSLSIRKIALLMLPSVDVFEDELLSLLSEDIKSDKSIYIEERRLKFLPYNGWTHSSLPFIAHLTKASSSGESSTTPRTSGNTLVFRGSLELTHLYPHHLMEVILQLEYIFGFGKGTSSPPHTVTIIVCWGVWLPFVNESMNEEEERVNLELKRGPGYVPNIIPNSAHKTCYENGLMDVGKMTFLSSPLNVCSKTGSDGQTPLSEITDSNPFHVGIEGTDSGVAMDKDLNTVDIGQPLNTSTPLVKPISSNNESTGLKPILPEHIHAISRSVVTMGTKRWIEPVSRSVMSYFHTSGISDIQDPSGKPLPLLDPIDATFPHEGTHKLPDGWSEKGHEITIQLLGIELETSPSFQCLLPSSVPMNISIEYQFLYDITTMSSIKLMTSSSHSTLPLILVDDTPGIKISHRIAPSPSISSELINNYISTSRLNISIYNNDSSILLGTAECPLYLLTLKDEFQLSLCIPIVYTNTQQLVLPIETLADSDFSSTIGRLYLRLGVTPSRGHGLLIPKLNERKLTDTMNTVVSYPLSDKDEQTDLVDDVKRRKHARMNAIRNKTDRNKHLQPVTRQKEDAISSTLILSLSSSISISPRIGETVYFEHEFNNIHDVGISVSIEWSDTQLHLISNFEEAQFLRHHFNIHGVIDDPSLISSAGMGRYGMYLSPHEKIKLPFKYQCLKYMDTCNHGNQIETKVYFSDSKNGVLLSVFNIKVTPMNQRIDRVQHFYHTEGIFMRKQIIIPSNLMNDNDLSIYCNDINTTCDVREYQDGDSLVVHIKAPVNNSPDITNLYLMIYNDKYMISPVEIWRLCIHSVQRLSHSMIMGESSLVKLNIKGDHRNRRIIYHAHSSNTIKVITPSSHIISPHSLNEVILSIKTLYTGDTRILISAKDDNTGDILMIWYITITTQLPTISKAFNINLPVGTDQDLKKNISWTNPYSKRKKFHISTTCPDLVCIKPDILKLQSSETVNILLYFSSSSSPQTQDIIIFINNSSDYIEECFLIKTNYN